VRFRATVRQDDQHVGSKTFDNEAEAKAWVRETSRDAVEKGRERRKITKKVRKLTRYRVMIRLKGYPAQYATFSRRLDAERWAQATEVAIQEGRHFKTAEARKHTLAELIDRYVTSVLARKEKKKRNDQERHLCWWRDRLGHLVLADVTPAVLVEARDDLAQGATFYGRQRSPATVNRYLNTLSHALTVASVEWEWFEENPLRRVRRLKEPRGRVRFLSDDERERLLEACRQSSEDRLFPLVVLALSTGARRGELLGLRWPDIDLERGQAVLHHTKNQERRAVPLTGLSLEMLKERSRLRRIDTDFVFANHAGRPTFPRKAWEEALIAAQLEDFRFHDLRHSAASYLAMSGATLAEIAEVLGHKTLAMVKRYAHLTDQHTSEVVARMNERFLRGAK
jgi:integrase